MIENQCHLYYLLETKPASSKSNLTKTTVIAPIIAMKRTYQKDFVQVTFQNTSNTPLYHLQYQILNSDFSYRKNSLGRDQNVSFRYRIELDTYPIFLKYYFLENNRANSMYIVSKNLLSSDEKGE